MPLKVEEGEDLLVQNALKRFVVLVVEEFAVIFVQLVLTWHCPTIFVVHRAAFSEQNVCHSTCLLYTSPSPRDKRQSRMPSSA